MQEITFLAYDTMCRVAADLAPGQEHVLARVQESAREVEARLSMFDPDSELSHLCRDYTPGIPVPVSDLLCDFLACNLDICRRSGGAFDPTVGPLIKLWDFLRDTPEIPSDQAIAACLERVGYSHLTLDRTQKTVTFDRPGIGLDPGASGKGYALGLAVDILRAAGVSNGVIDYGGNLFVLGQKQDERTGQKRPWKVAVRDPENPASVFGTVSLAGQGIATSSWYEHGFEKDGVIYHHLLDPRTGRPHPLSIQSVSILSTCAVFTDLLSTAFFLLGVEQGTQLVRSLAAESGERIDFVAVLEDGSIVATEGAGFLPRDQRTVRQI